VHLFQVEAVGTERRQTFEEVRPRLAAEWKGRRVAEILGEVEHQIENLPDVFVPTKSELLVLVRRNDPNAVVLRVGSFELRLSELQEMLETDKILRPQATGDRQVEILEQVRRSELVYQDRLRRGWTPSLEQERRLKRGSDQVLLELFREQRVRERAAGDVEALRDFYRDNQRRFSTSLVLELRRLSVPKMTAATMSRLEAARSDLLDGSLRLEDLAVEFSGSIDSLGPVTLAALSQLDPRLPGLVAPLEVDEATAPYSYQGAIHILEVTNRREPEVLPFNQIREAVITAYVERHGQELYEELRARVLENARYQFFEQHLEGHLVDIGEQPHSV
jgi:PHD/YefM family antitoxin component YafN of YafNO toxin-antitoxin module